jgi:hypothetical protein
VLADAGRRCGPRAGEGALLPGGAAAGGPGAGAMERPQAFWDCALCGLGLAREQVRRSVGDA